jgi:glycosyltransferase involved in cell wall biosynthesis
MDAQLAVIVPAYNAAATLAETLQAILRSTTSIEVVVVDDGSQDETVEIAQQFANADTRLRVLTQPNGGPTSARERGISATTAPLLVCCDADDVWDDGFAEAMVSQLERHPDAVLGVSSFRLTNDEGPVVSQSSYPKWVKHPVVAKRLHFVPTKQRDFAAASARLCFPPPAGVVVRRSAFEAAGGFDPTVKRSEDIECWIRLCQLGPFISIEDASFSYRVRPGQRSQSRGRQLGAVKAKLAVLRKCRTRSLLGTAVHGGLAFYATLARERLSHGVRHREGRSLLLGFANLGVCVVLVVAFLSALATPNAVRQRRFLGAPR